MIRIDDDFIKRAHDYNKKAMMDGVIDIRLCKVSGLRSTIFYTGRTTDDHYEHYDLEDAVITLKDGTTVVAKRTSSGSGLILEGGSVDWSGHIVLRYTYPINPADVSSITFGDYTINF